MDFIFIEFRVLLDGVLGFELHDNYYVPTYVHTVRIQWCVHVGNVVRENEK